MTQRVREIERLKHQGQTMVSTHEGTELAKKLKAIRYIESSAKLGSNLPFGFFAEKTEKKLFLKTIRYKEFSPFGKASKWEPAVRVDWDPVGGFQTENIPNEWKKLFQSVVRPSSLQKETNPPPPKPPTLPSPAPKTTPIPVKKAEIQPSAPLAKTEVHPSANVKAETTTTSLFLKDIKIGDKIGSGSFGVVYNGTWLGDLIALKSIPKAAASAIENELLIFKYYHHLSID
jgi:hypothetical protein